MTKTSWPSSSVANTFLVSTLGPKENPERFLVSLIIGSILSHSISDLSGPLCGPPDFQYWTSQSPHGSIPVLSAGVSQLTSHTYPPPPVGGSPWIGTSHSYESLA